VCGRPRLQQIDDPPPVVRDTLDIMHRLLARVRGLLARPTHNLLARAVTLNILGSLATGAVGFVGAIALARWLGPSNRGLLAVMLSVSTLALMLGGIGIPWATVYYSARSNSLPSVLLGNSLAQAAVLAAIVIPASWLLQQPLADAFGKGQGGMAWVLAAALVPIIFLEWTTAGQLQGMLRFGRFNALGVLSKLAYVLVILAFLGLLHLGVTAGLIATGVAAIVVIAGALPPILAFGRPRFERRLLRATLRYGSRVQVGSIFQLAMARLDVLILQFFRPLSQVGYYVVAQTIAELVLQLTRAFQQSVMPLVSSYEGDERQATTSADSVRHHGILAGAAVLANAVFGSLVILFVYGTKFHPAVVPMLTLLPGIWFLGMGGVIQSDLSGRGLPGTSSKLAGFAAAAIVALDFVLIPPFGVIGAALASVVAYTIYGLASLVALNRVSGIPVRQLVVPTRADLAGYWRFVRLASSRLRPTPGGAS
jgi:O-antigen/teichoic acid export membrane protein